MSGQKDIVYIDIDDEITNIVNKVQSSNQKIVALVLPKRASALQSVVNMKLLKRSAEESKKSLVLITSETSLMPLAGAAKLHVAKTLQSRPTIPSAPDLSDKPLVIKSNEALEDSVDATKPVGELAGLPDQNDDTDETIELDNDEPIDDEADADKKTKKGFNKKLKIPSFEKFRVKLFLAIFGVILLGVGWYVANIVLPKATITIKTDNSTVTSDLVITANPKATELDLDKKIVPATIKEIKRTDTEKGATTGQRDDGTKASGTAILFNCSTADKLDDKERTVPAGSGISSGGLTFIIQAAVTVQPSGFTGSTCKFDKPSSSVTVVAQAAGDKYNVAAKDGYIVAGFSTITADASAMGGGTSKLTKVVSQADIDTLKTKLTDKGTEDATKLVLDELKKAGFVGLEDTIATGTQTVTSNPKLNEEGAEVTVTAVTAYNMQGLKKEDLEKLIKKDAEGKIDTSKQKILDTGIDNVIFRIQDRKPSGEITLSMQTQVVAGPELNPEEIKKEIAGKKKGDTISTIQNRPGIKQVDTSFSPFWVFSTPKNVNKITINIVKSDATK
ncbi:MAG: hypothetical protein AAB459_04205 [Patescibacteria group bacterium]